MQEYLKAYFASEIVHSIGFCFEFITSIIAGHLIMLYSREPDDNSLRLDPISGIKVPSLIFVHNWQEIIDRMAGVRTETPEQFIERIRQQNLDYVREYVNGLLENENAAIY